MNQSTPKSEPSSELPVVRNTPAVASSFFQRVSFGGGIFLMLLCSGLIVTYVAEIVTGTTKHETASQLGLIVFLAGLVFVGWKMVQARLIEKKALKELKEEQLILNRARATGGSLSVSQTALDCQINIADAKKAFERLCMLNVCQVDVTDEGELCYRFPSLQLKLKSEEDFIIGVDFEKLEKKKQL